MKRALWPLAAWYLVSAALADPAPSVAVRTVPARRGTALDLITAYGTVTAAIDGGLTLSLAQPAQVTALLVAPGDAVRQGQKLLTYLQAPDALSAFRQAQTELTLARRQRAHTAQLRAAALATQDQLDQADKTLADAQTTLATLRAQGADGAGNSTLTAQFDGVVTTIAAAQGERLPPGAPLMTLTRRDGFVVTAGIEPADQPRVHPGQPARLLPLNGGAELAGTVTRVAAMLDPKTRLVTVEISLPPGAPLPGAAFRAAIAAGQITGWRVPHDAVLLNDAGARLFQDANGKAAQVSVAVTGADGADDIVQGPLDPALPVVTEGAAQLDPGAALRTLPEVAPPS